VNGVPLNTEKNLYSYFAKTAGRQIALSVNNTILKDAKEFTVVPVSSEVNLRQQDWVETNRRKVDKLSNGKLAYVWLPNTGEATQISTVTILPKDKKGAIIDERFNHGGQMPITSQMCFQEIFLVILIIPLGTIYSTKRRIWGPKVIINEMAGSVETCFRICLRCERLAHWLVQQRGEDLLEFGMFQVLLMEEPSLLLEAVSIT
jgi:tricorn protease